MVYFLYNLFVHYFVFFLNNPFAPSTEKHLGFSVILDHSEGSWRFSFIGQFLSPELSCWLILGTLTLLLLLVNINYFPGNP